MRGREDHPRKGSTEPKCPTLKILLLIVAANYIVTGPFKWSDYTHHLPLWNNQALLPQLHTSQQRLAITETQLADLHQQFHTSNTLLETLLQQLHTTQQRLAITETQLADLHQQFHTSNNLLETLLDQLGRLRESLPENVPVPLPTTLNHTDPFLGWGDHLSQELKLVLESHKLPFGFNPQFDSDKIFRPLGHACRLVKDDLQRYMDYQVGGECPVDDIFAQRLMLKGCEPLPRRRCHLRSPVNYVEPTPLPASLWSTPPDTSIIWDPYNCKDYKCLINRKNTPVASDCKDSFELEGREKTRWLHDSTGLDYGIDAVLALKKGTIHIGLDIGGWSGSFAARMRERNVTVITSSMNFDGPFNSFIASRGLVPIHITVSQRLPFFDNTLDIVHSMHVLSNWIPNTMLEFILYDIYRILRPGGLFWLDHFFCVGDQLNGTYVPMFNRIGFNKLRWSAGRKLDRGIQLNEWYLSTLLEKPIT